MCATGAPLLPADQAPYPVVTIITPLYNVEPSHLYATTQCILRQTLVAWEWLLVDDASDNPASLEAISHVASMSARIRVLRRSEGTNNVGLARNLGLQQAATSLVLFIDGDDLLEPTATEKWYWFLQLHPDAHFANSYVAGFGASAYLWTKSVNPSNQFSTENVASIMSMHKAESLRTIGGCAVQKTGLEDWQMWLNYAKAGKWGLTLPEKLAYYRRRKEHSDRWSAFNEQGIKTFVAERSRFPAAWPAAPIAKFNVLSSSSPEEARLGLWPRSVSGPGRLVCIFPWLVMGGADRFNLLLLTGLKALGWELTIITTLPSENSALDSFRSLTSDILLLATLGPYTQYPFIVDEALRLRQPAIVLLSNSLHGYAMLPFLRALHPLAVFVDYNHMEEEYWREGGHVRWSVVYSELLDASFVASARLKEWMTARGASASRIHVEYVGVNLTEWVPSATERRLERKVQEIGDDEVVVLYACRLVPQKQPLLAAEALVRVLARQRKEGLPLARFLVAGVGPLEQDMDKHFVFSGLDDGALQAIDFLGVLSAEEMRVITQASDVAFLPSVMEGIPTSFFEAMSLGVVVLGADVGASRELVVTGVTGILATYDGMTELAAAGLALEPSDPRFGIAAQVYADHLFALCTKPALRKRMAKAAAERVRKFDVNISIHNIHARFLVLLRDRERAAQSAKPLLRERDVALESYRLAVALEHGMLPLIHPKE